MALVVADRVQETTTTSGTGTLSLGGAVAGYRSFVSGIGSGNTTYYTIYDQTAQVWEVGIGTVTSGSPNTLSRTTVLSNSSGTTSPISLAGNSASVFCSYPAGKSVNLDASGNVTPLGTVSSGTWQGTTVGVAYGGTGVTTSSGANSVVLRDANSNITVNRLNQSSTTVTAAAGITTLTAASTFSQILVGTGGQTFALPDATTLTNTTTFEFNNNATGTLTIVDYASGPVGTIASGGAAAIALLSNGTVAGTWDVHAYIPENVTWGTNSLALGSTVISGGTWQGGTIQPGYGGTGLTTFTAANYALYSTSASALTAGTLPIAAGGTSGTATPTAGAVAYGTGSAYAFSSAGTSSQVLLSGGSGSPTWTSQSSLSVGSASTATSATTSTNLAGGATGSLPYQSASNTSSFLALGTTGYFLTAGASAPQWTQTLPVANGGTGQTSYTDGQLLIGNTATGGLSKATLSAGSNITITNGNGSITIASTGGGSSAPIAETSQTISTNYTLTAGTNGLSVGPVTVASGVSVTVPSGARYVVI